MAVLGGGGGAKNRVYNLEMSWAVSLLTLNKLPIEQKLWRFKIYSFWGVFTHLFLTKKKPQLWILNHMCCGTGIG
jgi:hypothetical protein